MKWVAGFGGAVGYPAGQGWDIGGGRRMDWIGQLKGLPETVAILLVAGIMLVAVLKSVMKWIVAPFSRLIENHLEHDAEERRQMRKVIEGVDKTLQHNTRVLENLAQTLQSKE